ncbi:Pycsar system effector family protein [Lentzea flava]|uniref:Pycsar effector protein domain-containing protein n=1 Tax=Lentzea flava TaxID=103732 RepID=A0ABQ2UF70_9PSEU|nr:Pycsar system effector family protein [Lentzea flava]GGU29110.1 hypothetical protein GCM10010178_21590 [Lentzea flava]
MNESLDPDAGLGPIDVSSVEPATGPAPEPDQAWKALGLVNDWIKHAEAKVGATLAASAVAATMLYNLVKDQKSPGLWLSIAAVACAVAVVAAWFSATMALIPRLSIVGRRKAKKAHLASLSAVDELPEDPMNLLFFANIARAYKDDGPSYIEVLRSLTADPEQLTRHIAHQVHANATVAHRKFAWTDRAIRFLVLGMALLGVVAIIVGSKG